MRVLEYCTVLCKPNLSPCFHVLPILTLVLLTTIPDLLKKTFNMANPRTTVPDLLKKMSRKSDQSVSAAETLANDLDEIFQAGELILPTDIVAYIFPLLLNVFMFIYIQIKSFGSHLKETKRQKKVD